MKLFSALVMLMLSVLCAAQDTISISKSKIQYQIGLGLIFNSVGRAEGGLTGYQFDFSALYPFTDRLCVGLGTSFDNYFPAAGETVLPFYSDIQYWIYPVEHSLYIRNQLGYGFFIFQGNDNVVEQNGGLMINPGVGIAFNSKRRTAFYIESGIRFQEAYYEIVEGSSHSTFDLTYRRIVLKLGFRF